MDNLKFSPKENCGSWNRVVPNRFDLLKVNWLQAKKEQTLYLRFFCIFVVFSMKFEEVSDFQSFLGWMVLHWTLRRIYFQGKQVYCLPVSLHYLIVLFTCFVKLVLAPVNILARICYHLTNQKSGQIFASFCKNEFHPRVEAEIIFSIHFIIFW